MIARGVDDRGNPYTVRLPAHIDGRAAARLNLHRPVNQESAMSNVLFGLFIAGTTFFMLFIVWRGLSQLFIDTWKQLAG